MTDTRNEGYFQAHRTVIPSSTFAAIDRGRACLDGLYWGGRLSPLGYLLMN